MTDELLFPHSFSQEEPCPYLPDREWRNFVVDPGPDATAARYQQFFDDGYRRVGHLVYRPACAGCHECRTLRVDVARYRPSRSHKKALRRNRDLTVELAPPLYTEEKRALLERYLESRHTGPMTAEDEVVRQTIFGGPSFQRELSLRLGGRLIGLGIVDLLPDVLSSVYFYFDPDEAWRSLGIFSMALEIEIARARGLVWYHPGYWIADCQAMNYKSRFGPAEVLVRKGVWEPLRAAQVSAAGD